jgi:hypothetical protein
MHSLPVRSSRNRGRISMVVIPYAAAAASMQNRHIRKDGLNSYNGRPKEAIVEQYISR